MKHDFFIFFYSLCLTYDFLSLLKISFDLSDGFLFGVPLKCLGQRKALA